MRRGGEENRKKQTGHILKSPAHKWRIKALPGESVWLTAGVSSVSWPVPERLGSGVGRGCTPVVH